MNVRGLGEIVAIAFDIDGTLYPQWALTIRAFPRYVRYGEFFMHYGLTRRDLHKLPPQEDFAQTQAQILGKRAHLSADFVKRKLNRIVYKGLEPYFKKIAPYEGAKDAIKAFKDAGFKIALLSDFPPEQKGDIWGIKQYCDVILGTEEIGALKPDPYPFLRMAQALNVEPQKILYVGNSVKYDVRGCHKVGMKSAYLLPFWRRVLHCPLRESEISFSNYEQIRAIVLQGL